MFTNLIRYGGLIVLSFALIACGDDDDSGGGGNGGGTETPAVSNGSGDNGGGGGSCGGTNLAFTNHSSGDSVSLTSTTAASLVDGAAYTAYAGDFAMSTDDLGIVSRPRPSEGEHLVTIAITIFNATETPDPIEVGQVIEYTPDFGVLTFRVTHEAGETLFGNNSGAEGTVTITSVGDTLCFEIDYADDEKELSGSFEAETKPV